MTYYKTPQRFPSPKGSRLPILSQWPLAFNIYMWGKGAHKHSVYHRDQTSKIGFTCKCEKNLGVGTKYASKLMWQQLQSKSYGSRRGFEFKSAKRIPNKWSQMDSILTGFLHLQGKFKEAFWRSNGPRPVKGMAWTGFGWILLVLRKWVCLPEKGEFWIPHIESLSC